MSYQALIHIDKIDFSSKRVIIIGAGWMADQYCQALHVMGIHAVTVISRKEESARQCCERYSYRPCSGGYNHVLPTLEKTDLVIIATPVHELKPAADFVVEHGNTNILVEKPGSLYSNVLFSWANAVRCNNNLRIRIAYNRLTYPNLWKLKELTELDGGIVSCRYTFTEVTDRIDFNNNFVDVYKRWGIANSLHVISMAHDLIGMPDEFTRMHSGQLDWHPSGARFVGSGVTKANVFFSYHADWGSAGRWGIEIMTPLNAYLLIPLEQLYVCKKGKFNWELIETISAFPTIKQGIAEEIAIMFDPCLEEKIPLVTLDKAAEYAKLGELIFNYN